MKEVFASLKILLGLSILLLIIHLYSYDKISTYFIYGVISYMGIILVLKFFQEITKSNILQNVLNILKIPIKYILMFGRAFSYYITIILFLFIYLTICRLITNGIILSLSYIPLKIKLSDKSLDYIGITSFVFVAVILNKLLKEIILLIFPLKIMFKNFYFEELNSSINYLLNQKTVKYLIYIFYLVIVILSSLENFQNRKIFKYLIDSEVILKSFATFIALDKCIDLISKVDFRPSEFLKRLKKLFEVAKNID